MENEQNRHPSRPPSMLMHSPIETPCLETVGRTSLWPFRWLLAFEQFLKVDPFTLSHCQKGRARSRTEISNDDTREIWR